MSSPLVESKSFKTVPLSRNSLIPIVLSRSFSFSLSAPRHLPRRSFAPSSLSLPRYLPPVPPILLSIPRRSQTLLADETRCVLNFLDRAFRSATHEFATNLQHPSCIRLHSSQPGVDSRCRGKSRLILNTSCIKISPILRILSDL